MGCQADVLRSSHLQQQLHVHRCGCEPYPSMCLQAKHVPAAAVMFAGRHQSMLLLGNTLLKNQQVPLWSAMMREQHSPHFWHLRPTTQQLRTTQ
jgi:hypothetical protein